MELEENTEFHLNDYQQDNAHQLYEDDDEYTIDTGFPQYPFNPNAYNYFPYYPEHSDSLFDQDPSEQESEEEEENENPSDRVWYRYPSQATFDEDSRTLFFDEFPFSEKTLEFRSQGSIRLFRVRPSQRCSGKVLHLIGKSRVFKEDYVAPVQELSLHDSIAHLVESPVMKDRGRRLEIT